MTMTQIEEMKIRAEMRAKLTHELRHLLKASNTPEQARKIVEEVLWERGKLSNALPAR